MNLIYVNIFKLKFLVFIKNTEIVVLALKLMRKESCEVSYNVIITTAWPGGGWVEQTRWETLKYC